MATFRDLSLGPDLCDALESLGYRSPTAFQADAIPVLLRGTPALAVASAGSGKTLAYALPVLERLDPPTAGARPQALILRPTDAQAAQVALLPQRLGRARGIGVTALRPERLRETMSAQVVAGSPRAALGAVQRSLLKVDAVRTFVVDGLSDMLAWGAATDLDTITSLLPKDAQRVVFTSRWTADVEDWLKRHARRARRLGGAGTGGAAALGAVGSGAPELSAEYLAESPARWTEHLASTLDAARAKGVERAVVFCRTEEEARALADGLAVHGFEIAPAEKGAGLAVVWEGGPGRDTPVTGAFSISCGSPADAGTLRRRCQGAARTLLIVPPDEQVHLKAAAQHARVRLHPARAPLPEEATRSLADLRSRLRSALADRDLAPYLLALEPLFTESTAAEVAAAAAALLRERAAAVPEPPKVTAWTRLYFGVGKKDGIRPADLVGCVTGEAGITGAQVGRIDIREAFSVVEVSADVAERVLRALSKVTLRGRTVNVRPFRT